VFLCGLVAAGAAVGFHLGGRTAPAAQAAGARPIVASVSKATDARAPAGVDLDGDSRLDLARPVDNPLRGVDAYGSGAYGAARDGGRRRHQGVDFLATPGEPVRAPIAGVVTRIGAAYAGQDRLQFVEIANAQTRYTARVLYVGATVALGSHVDAGDLIGSAQDLTVRYALGITNHVHLELVSNRMGHLDPTMLLPGA
jgi:murein DD-endopeptidase MepM/ murein hydrolase activator NlpD